MNQNLLVAVLLNLKSDGKAWKEQKITYSQVDEINSKIADGSEKLWLYIKEKLHEGKRTGLFYSNEPISTKHD